MIYHQKGQGLVEYALILLLVALIVIAGISLVGESTRDVLGQVGLALQGQNAVYCDSDMSNSDEWQYEGSGTGSWTINDGMMCRVTDYQNGFAYSRCSQTDKMRNASDYVIHLKNVVLERGQGYGVMFRVQNYEARPNGYSFQYDPGLNGMVFRKWINGWELSQPIAYQRLTDYEWYGIPRDIELVVKGNTFEAFIDGELVLTAEDDTWSSGGMGLRTWGITEVCFDELSISETD